MNRDSRHQDVHELQTEVMTTEQILEWSDEAKNKLKTELDAIFRDGFPKAPENYLNENIRDFFYAPGDGFKRHVIFWRNKDVALVAIMIFDCGIVEYGGYKNKVIYIINRVIGTKYRGAGLAKIIGKMVLTEWSPDILLTTCAQSPILYAWINLVSREFDKLYEIYPRLMEPGNHRILMTVPYNDLEHVIHIFRKIYKWVVNGDTRKVEKSIRNLTVCMARKNVYHGLFDFDPWCKGGREDVIARELCLEKEDGMLVVIRKIKSAF